MTTLVIEFRKLECNDATKCTYFYSNLKAETIINESNIDYVFKSIYTSIIWDIQIFEKVWARFTSQPNY